MCGIAGFVNYSKNNESLIRGMCDVMYHRGPDDEGYYVDERVSLGMRRLSIIDISGGHQPIYNEDKSIVCILNGEIYNYKEIRRTHCMGHTFSTNTDTEVLVHLYEEYHEEMFGYLNGMFSFAIYDIRRCKLLIGRDRIGIKPLYYTLRDGAIVFASEIKPLLSHVKSKSLNIRALRDYLSLTYVPSPYSMMENIHKVEAGTFISYDCLSHEMHEKTYWEPRIALNEAITESQAIEKLDYLFKDSIRLQMQSDVPVGTFLSGGLDSSAVVAYESLASNYAINTFSVGFSDNNYNELPYARVIADKFGTKHNEVVIGDEELLRYLPKLISSMEEPCGDSAFLPTYILSKYASGSVKVILNGTGGDELFGGYKRYSTKQYLYPLLRAMRYLPQSLVDLPLRLSPEYKKAGIILKYLKNEEYFYINRSLLYDDKEVDAVVRHKADGRSLESRITAELNKIKNADQAIDYPTIFMLMDIKSYLKNDLLLLLDKIMMSCSLEGRVPFLDHRIVEFSLSLPVRYKIRKNSNKHIMKKWLEGSLGYDFVNRPKIGFGAPIDRWYGLRFKKYANELLLDPLVERRGILNMGGIEAMMKSSGPLIPQKVFNIVCLELWLREYFDK